MRRILEVMGKRDAGSDAPAKISLSLILSSDAAFGRRPVFSRKSILRPFPQYGQSPGLASSATPFQKGAYALPKRACRAALKSPLWKGGRWSPVGTVQQPPRRQPRPERSEAGDCRKPRPRLLYEAGDCPFTLPIIPKWSLNSMYFV